MFLLQISTDTDSPLIIFAIAFLVNLLILYYIIKGAVAAATKDLGDKLQKLIELQGGKAGMTDKEIELERLKRSFETGGISLHQYQKRMNELTGNG